MPLPPPVLHPPFNIVRLGYTSYRVTDLARSRAFYVGTLGMQVAEERDDALYLRCMEERVHHSIVLQKAETAEVAAVGFRVFEESDLDKAQAFFDSLGLPTTWENRLFTGRTLCARDPWGMPLEFYAVMAQLPPIHQQYRLYHGAKPLRIDHCNFFSADVDEAVKFYNSLGFRTTEYTEDPETGKLWAAWLHRKGGVHDIAFTNGAGPRLHHTAIWVPTPLNIIDLLDLMSTTGWIGHIERGPGRHGISNAFFLYIRDPDNNRIELYCSDYQTVDPDLPPIKWDLQDPQRQTLWGAPAPRSWFEEGGEFAGAETKEPQLRASPIIAP